MTYANSKEITVVRHHDPDAYSRRYLVVIRTGSKPYTGMAIPKIRNFDLLMNYYEPPADENLGDIVVAGGLSKFHTFKMLAKQLEGTIMPYDGVYFFDDDVKPRYDLDDFFLTTEMHGLDLCQASLSSDSISGWRVTRNCPSFTLRYTNFVECMAPYFSRDYLQEMIDTFDWSYSAWGLDFWWGHHCARAAIIDQFEMFHPPGAGNNFDYLKAHGIDPQAEYRAMRNRMGGGSYKIEQFDFLPRDEASR